MCVVLYKGSFISATEIQPIWGVNKMMLVKFLFKLTFRKICALTNVKMPFILSYKERFWRVGSRWWSRKLSSHSTMSTPTVTNIYRATINENNLKTE